MLLAAPGQGLMPPIQAPQTVDRVVGAVGTSAITATDVENEYRLELFLGGRMTGGAPPGRATLDQVRQRMIDRLLLLEEVRTDGIKVAPSDAAVSARWSALRGKFPNPAMFDEGLRGLGMSEDALRAVLAAQEEVLRLIDQRLRPEAVVEPAEIDAYYHDTLLPKLSHQTGETSPPPAEVEGRIREILVQQKIDVLLEDWLKRLRARGDVRVIGSAEVDPAR